MTQWKVGNVCSLVPSLLVRHNETEFYYFSFVYYLYNQGFHFIEVLILITFYFTIVTAKCPEWLEIFTERYIFTSKSKLTLYYFFNRI